MSKIYGDGELNGKKRVCNEDYNDGIFLESDYKDGGDVNSAQEMKSSTQQADLKGGTFYRNTWVKR